jgi:hypothetical protein
VLVLVLVQMQVQAEKQVEGQQMLVFLGKDLVNQHTAVPNVKANSGKQEQVEAQWQRA